MPASASCAVLELVLHKFPTEPSILLAFTQHALTAAAAATASGADATAAADAPAGDKDGGRDSASYARQLEHIVLEVSPLLQAAVCAHLVEAHTHNRSFLRYCQVNASLTVYGQLNTASYSKLLVRMYCKMCFRPGSMKKLRK
jgi:hypothetical protein